MLTIVSYVKKENKNQRRLNFNHKKHKRNFTNKSNKQDKRRTFIIPRY